MLVITLYPKDHTREGLALNLLHRPYGMYGPRTDIQENVRRLARHPVLTRSMMIATSHRIIWFVPGERADGRRALHRSNAQKIHQPE
jgi:hypothetical protein